MAESEISMTHAGLFWSLMLVIVGQFFPGVAQQSKCPWTTGPVASLKNYVLNRLVAMWMMAI
jgi:hypothetical protein